MTSEVLFIGGRSGVGKSSAAIALHELPKAHDVRHAVIEGDYLDLAHPAPGGDLAARNLGSLWARYRELGYRKLMYTNTASVVEVAHLVAAMADEPRVTAVLLRAADATAEGRLHARAVGTAPDADLANSAATARRLDEVVPPDVHRLDTDGLTPAAVAAELARLTGWL